MIQKLKLLLLPLISVVMFSLPFAATSATYAQNAVTQPQINQGLCNGSNGDFTGGTTTTCSSSQASNSLNHIVTVVINILSVVVGVVAVIMIIIAGFQYVTSGGKDESVKTAKNMILYAIIGLVIVALAQIIVHFVLHTTTQATTGA